MKNIFTAFIPLLAVTALVASCEQVVEDEATNAYVFSAVAETVREGNDIPIHLVVGDGGLVPDNAGWGNKWSKVTFYASMTDNYGHTVENAVYSGPSGFLANGSVFDIPESGKFDLVVGSLREGEYNLKINLQTRYTVDTWASVDIVVKERGQDEPDEPGGDVVVVKDIVVPSEESGFDIDEIGNVILDLRYFNTQNPSRFNCRVSPENATDKQLLTASSDVGIADVQIEGQTLLVMAPKSVGACRVTVRSRDGGASRSFGLRVIESKDEATGFTLPVDDGEKEAYDFDVAGRLELDIDKWNEASSFAYECKPIPSTAGKPDLVASSDNTSVLVADIENGNRLILTPKSPGYATVTVATRSGSIVRSMRVVVFSAFSIVVDAVEAAASEADKPTGIFPCELTFRATSRWIPKMMQVEVYGKATGRIDLTDPVDYFKVDSLKNARTAYFSYQEKVPVLYLTNGNSAYDIYSRLMKKVASMGAVVHHDADWPNYRDYIVYFRLYKITLNLSMVNNYDSNVYRITIAELYDDPKNKLYQYLY